MRALFGLIGFVAFGGGCTPPPEREFVREDEVDEPAGSDITVSTFSCNFGVVTVNQSASCPVTITNDGERDLIVDSVELIDVTPDNTTPFSLGSAVPTGSVVAPSEHVVVDVRFSPAAAAEYTGALRILSNDARTPAIDVTLTGSGTP